MRVRKLGIEEATKGMKAMREQLSCLLHLTEELMTEVKAKN